VFLFYNFSTPLSFCLFFRSDEFCAILIEFQYITYPSCFFFVFFYFVFLLRLDVVGYLPHCAELKPREWRNEPTRRDQMFPSVKPGGPCAPFVRDRLPVRFEYSSILQLLFLFLPFSYSYNIIYHTGRWIFEMCQRYIYIRDFVIPPGRRVLCTSPHIISDIWCRYIHAPWETKRKEPVFLLIAFAIHIAMFENIQYYRCHHTFYISVEFAYIDCNRLSRAPMLFRLPLLYW
jgi:hypothetical protein